MQLNYHFLHGAIIALILTSLVYTDSAHAQEPINSPAATQPSVGRWVLRNQFKYMEAGTHPETGESDFRQFTVWNNIAYGITSDLSMNLTVPIYHERFTNSGGSRDHATGIGDLTLMAKWRIHQHDFGPIDTSRFSILAGLEIPSFDNHFSTRGVNPIIGGVYTHVQGRHGFNLSGRYKFNTGRGTPANLGGGKGRDDALFYDASYLFRLDPAEYGPDTLGAWYALVEFNGIYETNGDNEIFIGPGIMYEARTWTVEAAVQLPIHRDVDRRPKSQYIVTLGLRLLF